MATPRMFNSNTPFVIVTGGSELSFLTKDEEEEQDSLDRVITPHLSRLMRRGTAKHLVTEGRDVTEGDNGCVSIVAQAEREDFQEFSPSSTQCPYSRCQLIRKHRSLSVDAAILSDTEDEGLDAKNLQRKQRRKVRRQEYGEHPPIIRGLWVQEIDWLKSAGRETAAVADIIPPPPQFSDVRALQDDSDSDCLDSRSVYTQESESDSSCGSDDQSVTFDLMQVSGFASSSHSDSDSTGCVQSLQGFSDSSCAFGLDELSAVDTVVDGLRGKVMRLPKLFVSAFFRDLMDQTQSDWQSSRAASEGLLFHQLLQVVGAQYREGHHYSVLHHIQNGSYGDVLCVRDKRTGFRCAAKKIPLSHFSSEEVSTWSALSSPRVVELFGAVREGLSVVLFMDLKPGCLAQLLKEMEALPEDLSLHYLHQTLGALEHLHHRKVLHLDVKVDNVLLSADCRDTFLCDFGLSKTLDVNGWRTDGFRGAAFPGTQTHMAPEVALGDRLSSKADIWSCCCMLLHMLNGHHPWIRYYSQPLCLQIVNEPPPLWEVPSTCNNFTAKVFRAGLQKDPDRRASAKELQRKTTKALRAVGGLSPRSVRNACEKLHRVEIQSEDAGRPLNWVSPWRTTAVDEDRDDSRGGDLDQDSDLDSLTREWESGPKSLQDDSAAEGRDSGSEVDMYMAEEDIQEYEGDWEDEEEDWDSSRSTEYLQALRGIFPLLQKGHQMETSWGSELENLRDDVAGGTRIQTPSPEPRDDPPSCFSCSDSSQLDSSEEDSDRSSDDLSSGVFSSCNRSDGRLAWLASANQPSSCCFEGVDVWIETVQGECLRIRERRRVKVGHVAMGISEQVSGKPFTLETLDRKSVSLDQQIGESSLWLRCVPAPDRCERWRWRVRDGKLELRERGGQFELL